jgi:hypothetical protein
MLVTSIQTKRNRGVGAGKYKIAKEKKIGP